MIFHFPSVVFAITHFFMLFHNGSSQPINFSIDGLSNNGKYESILRHERFAMSGEKAHVKYNC